MSRRPYRTANQREIMAIILQNIGAGILLSSHEIHDQISYGSTEGAVRKTLATLLEQDFLLKERDGRRVIYRPTQKGYDWFRPRS